MRYIEVPLSSDEVARLDCYLQDADLGHGYAKTMPALIIAPGGGYLHLAAREGEPVAMRFLGLGFNTFVLRYRTLVVGDPVEPEGLPQIDPKSVYPVQVVEAMRAMAWVRGHAEEYDIDPQRVYVLGFSAGAHVVGSLSEQFDDEELLAQAQTTAEMARPDGTVLCYPMVSANLDRWVEAGFFSNLMPQGELISQAVFGTLEPTQADYERLDLCKNVRPDQPRTFIWQTGEDATVPTFESYELATALQRAGVPVELHVFERGPHGMSLADRTTARSAVHENDEAAAWVELCARWLALDAPETDAHPIAG